MQQLLLQFQKVSTQPSTCHKGKSAAAVELHNLNTVQWCILITADLLVNTDQGHLIEHPLDRVPVNHGPVGI